MRGARSENLVTSATIETQEWDAFKAKLAARSRLLKAGVRLRALKTEDVDVDEDDVDMLLSMIDALERAQAAPTASPRTIHEIVRAMQRDKVLSLEFASAARAQARRLLVLLREMNRVYQDSQGRWALL